MPMKIFRTASTSFLRKNLTSIKDLSASIRVTRCLLTGLFCLFSILLLSACSPDWNYGNSFNYGDAFYEHSEQNRAKRADCRDFVALNIKEISPCVELRTGKLVIDDNDHICRRFAKKVNECKAQVDLLEILRKAPRQPLHVAVVWPKDPMYGNLVAGALLAQEEVNRAGGILGGRPIQLWGFDDTLDIANTITQNLDILASIGHRDSQSSILASVSYEYRGMLYLSPRATRMALTTHSFQYVFRTIPNSKHLGAQLAHFMHWRGHKRVVILYSRDAYSEELAALFYENAVDMGIEIVHRASFFQYRTNFRAIIADFRGKKFDGIFLSTLPEAAANLIKQSRDMGIKDVPFVGVDEMNSPLLPQLAGAAAEGVAVPTVYDPRTASSLSSLQFIENYQRRFKQMPDTWAAQGYDAVKLLAYAMEESKSSVPLVVATTLRYLEFWLGATGVHRFDRSGDMSGKLYRFNELKNGKFESVGSAHMYYVLDKIKKYKLKPDSR